MKKKRFDNTRGGWIEALEGRVLLDTVTWDGGGGDSDWHNAANWDRNGVDAVPQDDDDVVIATPAVTTVLFSAGELVARSITANQRLRIAGGRIGVTGEATLAAGVTVAGGTIAGGRWIMQGSDFRATSSSTNRVIDVAIEGQMTLPLSARLRVQGDFSLNGAATLVGMLMVEGTSSFTGTAAVDFDGGKITIEGDGTLTLAETFDISGNGEIGGFLETNGVSRLVNRGRISTRSAGNEVAIKADSFENHGWLSTTASNSRLMLRTNWSNPTGTITGVPQSRIYLIGDCSSSEFQRVDARDVYVFVGGTIENSGGVFDILKTFGRNIEFGGTIVGGTVVVSPGGGLVMVGTLNRFVGVTLIGELTTIGEEDALRIVGGLTLHGEIVLRRYQAGLIFEDTGELAGNGVIQLEENGTFLAVERDSTLTIGPGITIRGRGASIGAAFQVGGASAIINYGLISSEPGSSVGLSIDSGSFENRGRIELYGSTSELWLNGSWSNEHGEIFMVGGQLNLGGQFSTASLGTFVRLGGEVNLWGTAHNQGRTLDFTGWIGEWHLRGGTVDGGTMIFSGGRRLLLTNSSGLLRGVEVRGELLLDTAGAQVRVIGGTRFDRALMLAATTLTLGEGYVLRDQVVAGGALSGTRTIRVIASSASDVIVTEEGEILLSDNAAGDLVIDATGSTRPLANFGMIRSEAPGRILMLQGGTFSNQGVVHAGGPVRFNSVVMSNLADGELAGGSWIVDDRGEIVLPGGARVSTNAAVVRVRGSGRFAALESLALNRGTIELRSGGSLMVTPPSDLRNSGVIDIDAGSRLVVTGNFSAGVEGMLVARVTGATGPLLQVSGVASLDGNLRIEVPSETPLTPLRLQLISASQGGVAGTFATAALPRAPLLQSYIDSSATGVSFVVSSIADFNRDGTISSEDFFEFLAVFLVEKLDVNGDGIASSQDFFDFLTAFFEG